MVLVAGLLLLGVVLVNAQDCANYGVRGGSNCSCPVGDIFQGSGRKLAPQQNGFANVSDTSCSCGAGWGGLGCNVCSTAAACQAAFSASGHAPSDADSIAGDPTGQNDTLTCNTAARVYAASQMSCQVVNPTLAAIFPLSANLNILRTLEPNSSPIPNTTSFGSNGTGKNSWECQNLKCFCIPKTQFCGAGISDLTATINSLTNTLGIECDNNSTTCFFKQDTLNAVFGSGGLSLSGCTFGECVAQRVIDTACGVIGGLAAVGALLLIAFAFLVFGLIRQRSARHAKPSLADGSRTAIEWSCINYVVPAPGGRSLFGRGQGANSDKVVLNAVSGRVGPGQMMAVLGPSGAGKTTLVEILAGKAKSGTTSGLRPPRIGFVPQQDVLRPMLTVYEALLFGARLRLPENAGAGDVGGGKARGISGGEMRRVSIGLELISSLDSVSASRVAKVLHAIAHDSENPIPVIASIHQPSSQLYQIFDSILVMSHGRALYCGPGGFAPAEFLQRQAPGAVPTIQQGYNVADYLLDVASDPPPALFELQHEKEGEVSPGGTTPDTASMEKRAISAGEGSEQGTTSAAGKRSDLQYLCGREWKILRRDKSLFFTHVGVASILGVFCGGLYFQTGITIAGFQSRVGCLFFWLVGALIAFSSLSALYNIVEIRPLFLRERSSSYYSPTAWLLSRLLFDVIPLRIIPTIIVGTITYWMAGLAHDAAHYFKFLFILVLYTLAMTLYNFLLGTFFQNGGIAILLSALSALYQMTFAGFFVHLESIPPVLRWLQWLCPLKYCLEALAVNEVGSGLMIQDTLASLIMNLLFGFGSNNYYRDVLVLFAFIAGFGVGVIGIVWLRVRERR
ncbi:Abc transporter [Favolaschia claudopus]|uniref:Abc transporter n=1 Tax=Favolaschia claudopus TaxID=2862362 RepID=A0AAW0CB09_9AGAR